MDRKRRRRSGDQEESMEGIFQGLKHHSALLLLFLTGAVVWFLNYLSPLVSPFILALLFLAIFGPLLKRLQKIHVPRQMGAILLLITALLAVVGIGYALARWAWNGLPQLFLQAEEWKAKLPDWADGWLDFGIRELKLRALDMENGMLGGALRYTGRLASFGGSLVAFLIAVILLAKDYDAIMNRLLEREDCHLLLTVICSVIHYIATYVRAQGIIMTMIATLCAVVLTIAGVSQGVFWGILAGLLDALPFIGTGVILTPLAIIQVIEGKTVGAVICGALYVACILVRELMEPRLIGKKMGVSPILILVSLYVGIRLFGVAGIIKGPLGFVIIWEVWQNLKSETKIKQRQEEF